MKRLAALLSLLAVVAAPACAGTTAELGPAPPGAHVPVAGDQGVYEDCDVLFEGYCYSDRRDACAAAGCPDSCTILRTQPGMVSCAATPEP